MNTNPLCCTVGVLIWLTAMQNALAFYNPSEGKWFSRDPLGEAGFQLVRHSQPDARGDGPNDYVLAANNPVNGYDILGLEESCGWACYRAVYPDAISVPIIREISEWATCVCTPHLFLATKHPKNPIPDGEKSKGELETFSYPFGKDTDPTHWSVHCSLIERPKDKTCKEFWDCIRGKDWSDKAGKYKWGSHNCQNFAKKAVKDCGGRIAHEKI